MPQLDLRLAATAFWLAVTFLALYFVISRVAIPRTGGVIALRKSTIDGDLPKAKNLKDETKMRCGPMKPHWLTPGRRPRPLRSKTATSSKVEIEAERAKLDAALGAKIATAERKWSLARQGLGRYSAMAADIAGDIVTQLTGAKVTKAEATAAVSKTLGK